MTNPKVLNSFQCLQDEYFTRKHSVNTDESLYFSFQDDTLYITKCICLITSLPLITPCQIYLKQLYDITIGGKDAALPLESYLQNLIFDLPVPHPGTSMQFSGPLSPISFRLPGKMDLPLCDYSFKDFFQSLRLRTVLKLFTCILLERRVLLISYGKLIGNILCCYLSNLRFSSPYVVCSLHNSSFIPFFLAPCFCTNITVLSIYVLGCSCSIYHGLKTR